MLVFVIFDLVLSSPPKLRPYVGTSVVINLNESLDFFSFLGGY